MRKSIFVKTLYDKRWFMLGWSLGFVGLAVLMVFFYPAMNTSGALDALTKNMPEAFAGLVGNLSYLSEFSTYLASQLFDIRGSIFAGIVAIMLGLSLTVGDEDKGYIRTMATLPVSRTRLLLAKWLAMVVIMGVIVATTMLSVYLTAPFVNEAVSGLWLLRLSLGLWLLMTATGSLVFGAGMATGKRAIATTIGVLVVAVSFVITTFGTAVDWLAPYKFLSVYYYFPTIDIVEHGFALLDVSVLMGLVALPLLVALLMFRQRDIAAGS